MQSEVALERHSTKPDKSNAYLAIARTLYGIRRKREAFIDPVLLGEPVWDILLNLYIAEHENRKTPTTKSCVGGAASQTTGLRALDRLEKLGYIERCNDEKDRRLTLVCLTAQGITTMDSYIASIAGLLGHYAEAAL